MTQKGTAVGASSPADLLKGDMHPAVNGFLRALATGTVAQKRDAWRAVLDEGAETIEPIRRKLTSPAWEKPPRGPSTQYLAGLLSVLAEIDRKAFDDAVSELSAKNIHSMHRKVVDFIGQAINATPLEAVGQAVPVFVTRDVSERERVAGLIKKWAGNPLVDLSGVSRIDVIARTEDADFFGLYDIVRSTIVVNWPPSPPGRRWLNNLQVEWTFLHEVGHHVCGHLEGGTVKEQEDEANAFASRAFRRSHPLLSGAVRGLLLPIKMLFRLRAALRRV